MILIWEYLQYRQPTMLRLIANLWGKTWVVNETPTEIDRIMRTPPELRSA